MPLRLFHNRGLYKLVFDKLNAADLLNFTTTGDKIVRIHALQTLFGRTDKEAEKVFIELFEFWSYFPDTMPPLSMIVEARTLAALSSEKRKEIIESIKAFSVSNRAPLKEKSVKTSKEFLDAVGGVYPVRLLRVLFNNLDEAEQNKLFVWIKEQIETNDDYSLFNNVYINQDQRINFLYLFKYNFPEKLKETLLELIEKNFQINPEYGSFNTKTIIRLISYVRDYPQFIEVITTKANRLKQGSVESTPLHKDAQSVLEHIGNLKYTPSLKSTLTDEKRARLLVRLFNHPWSTIDYSNQQAILTFIIPHLIAKQQETLLSLIFSEFDDDGIKFFVRGMLNTLIPYLPWDKKKQVCNQLLTILKKSDKFLCLNVLNILPSFLKEEDIFFSALEVNLGIKNKAEFFSLLWNNIIRILQVRSQPNWPFKNLIFLINQLSVYFPSDEVFKRTFEHLIQLLQTIPTSADKMSERYEAETEINEDSQKIIPVFFVLDILMSHQFCTVEHKVDFLKIWFSSLQFELEGLARTVAMLDISTDHFFRIIKSMPPDVFFTDAAPLLQTLTTQINNPNFDNNCDENALIILEQWLFLQQTEVKDVSNFRDFSRHLMDILKMPENTHACTLLKSSVLDVYELMKLRHPEFYEPRTEEYKDRLDENRSLEISPCKNN